MTVDVMTEVDVDIRSILCSRWKVILLNDNKTSMEFVIFILMNIFNHSQESATIIMLNIHNEGRGLAGVFSSREIAEQKIFELKELAKEFGYPLNAIAEE